MNLKFLSVMAFLLLGSNSMAGPKGSRTALINNAQKILEMGEISYVYGGNKVGSPEECRTCNQCLSVKKPKPKKRAKACPSCRGCSLDCSHFTQLLLDMSGLHSPYLTTKAMLELSKTSLMKKYNLVDVTISNKLFRVGDLLVYRGHVAMIERITKPGWGDIVHSTGGRDIREPGQGVQRERQVEFKRLRGPLLRVLRHKKLYNLDKFRTIR